MPMRSKKAKKAPRRRNRKAKLYSGMKGGALKTWTYNFKLTPQFLTNRGVGNVDMVSAAGGTAARPIFALTAPTPGVTNNTTTSPLGSNYIDVGLGCTHSLADIANQATFASMYDAYKINYVVCEIEYLNNVSSTQGQAIMPTIWTYWDQDDAVPPVVTTNVTGKQGSKCFHPTSSKTRFHIKYRPMLRDTVQDSVGTANAVVKPATWINCTQVDVPHYAFKGWITDYYTQSPAVGTNAFRINWTYNVSFRAPLLTT